VVGPFGSAGGVGTAEPSDIVLTQPATGGSRVRLWGVLLIVGWLAQAALRAWLSRTQVVPLATPDEPAYLIAARVLAGGFPANFSDSTLYPAGYPLLITPVFWLTSNPVTAYHAVMMINALVSAAVMPLAYVACRRLKLSRPEAYGVAMVAALLPAALFYAEYALADAIYPVLVLAWLLVVHSWLTAGSPRGRYAAAIGSALLAGYAYAVHSRGLVILAVYVAVGMLIAWRRLAPRGTVVAAALSLAVSVGVTSMLNGKLAAAMYPSGARSLSGEALIRLHSVRGAMLIADQAAGQMWRFVLDGWGVTGIGFVAAVAFVLRRGGRIDLKIMAALSVAITLAIAVLAPAGLPPDTSQTWASGRYLDCMVVAFFLPGAAVLLRADRRRILTYAAWVVPPTLVLAVTVEAYAGASVPTSGFGSGFNFAEPAVLTQDWTRANVFLATAAALLLLAAWVAVVLAADRFGTRWRAVVLVGLGAVSLVAVVQMTSHISQASTRAEKANTIGLVTGSGLKPGEYLAVGRSNDTKVYWGIWMPQAYEIPWAQLEFFDPASEPPPTNATVVEVAWPAGLSAQASWPRAPAGWRIVVSDRSEGWVAWRRLAHRVPWRRLKARGTAQGAGPVGSRGPVYRAEDARVGGRASVTAACEHGAARRASRDRRSGPNTNC
jgi:hypothetical protein